jgi:hypothetical protein
LKAEEQYQDKIRKPTEVAELHKEGIAQELSKEEEKSRRSSSVGSTTEIPPKILGRSLRVHAGYADSIGGRKTMEDALVFASSFFHSSFVSKTSTIFH